MLHDILLVSGYCLSCKKEPLLPIWDLCNVDGG